MAHLATFVHRCLTMKQLVRRQSKHSQKKCRTCGVMPRRCRKPRLQRKQLLRCTERSALKSPDVQSMD